MTTQEDRDRQIKLMLGYDPDDPNISIVTVTPDAVTATETEESDQQLNELMTEIMVAVAGHTTDFHSPYEGITHITARHNELWHCVIADAGCGETARRTAVRLAAEAVWYILTLTDKTPQKG